MSEGRAAAHLILYVADQPRAAQFYRRVLGRPPRLDVPGMTELILPGGAVLGLMPESGIERLLPGLDTGRATRPSRAELYLRFDEAGALHAAWERAVAAGADVLSSVAPRDWGDLAGYLRDPDGHVLALAACLEQG